ncbi:MAG: Hint domain-containing protein, partial [Candidatus Woesearchaeota archaeon]
MRKEYIKKRNIAVKEILIVISLVLILGGLVGLGLFDDSNSVMGYGVKSVSHVVNTGKEIGVKVGSDLKEGFSGMEGITGRFVEEIYSFTTTNFSVPTDVNLTNETFEIPLEVPLNESNISLSVPENDSSFEIPVDEFVPELPEDVTEKVKPIDINRVPGYKKNVELVLPGEFGTLDLEEEHMRFEFDDSYIGLNMKIIVDGDEKKPEEFSLFVDENITDYYKWGYSVKAPTVENFSVHQDDEVEFLAKINVKSNLDISLYSDDSLRIGDHVLSFNDLVLDGFVVSINEIPDRVEVIDETVIANISDINETDVPIEPVEEMNETVNESEILFGVPLNESGNLTNESGGFFGITGSVVRDVGKSRFSVVIEKIFENLFSGNGLVSVTGRFVEEIYDFRAAGVNETLDSEFGVPETNETNNESLTVPGDTSEFIAPEKSTVVDNGKSVDVYIYKKINATFLESVGGKIELDPVLFTIIITKAKHLDFNRSFISDIYEEVKELDGNWSETIPSGDYVRVTFERNLTRENDITIYPRTVNGTPKIEVYEEDKNELIAEFSNLTDNEYNKVYLTGLGECYDNETEILTEEGWRYFYELGDEKVATLNPLAKELEWQRPLDKQIFDHDGEMYRVETENGELVVSPEHRVYVSKDEPNKKEIFSMNLDDNQISLFRNNLSKSPVLYILINDCCLKCESFDQIAESIERANARKSTSSGSSSDSIALSKKLSYSSNLKKVMDSSISFCLISNSCSESFDLDKHSSLCFINSDFINSGAKNLALMEENRYAEVDFEFIIANKTLLSNTSFISANHPTNSLLFLEEILSNNSSLLFGCSSESSSLNLPFFTFLPNSTDHLMSSCSSLDLNFLSNCCFNISRLSKLSLTSSDQFTQGNWAISDFSSSSTANVMDAIYITPLAFNFSSFLSSPTFSIIALRATSATFTSGNNLLNFFNNFSGTDTVILGILYPPSIYVNKSKYVDVFKPFDSEKDHNFSLRPIKQVHEEFEQGKEIYFLGADGEEIKVNSITKVPYSGKIYDVDVENDIVLVRRKSEKKLVENYDEDSNRSQILDAQVSDFGQDLGAGFWMNGCRKMDGTEGGGVGGLTGEYGDLGAVEEGFADGGCRILDG